MGIFDKLYSYLSEVNEAQENEQENMKYKTDAELKRIATEGGASSRAMGKRKAAIEELRRRGYNV